MAGIKIEGELKVDLAAFYQWAETAGIELGAIDSIDLNKEEQMIELTGSAGTQTVDMVGFWEWMQMDQLPDGLAGMEILFGTPTFGKEEITVPIALSDYLAPERWDEPPRFLA